jgi:hypothetical protein
LNKSRKEKIEQLFFKIFLKNEKSNEKIIAPPAAAAARRRRRPRASRKKGGPTAGAAAPRAAATRSHSESKVKILISTLTKFWKKFLKKSSSCLQSEFEGQVQEFRDPCGVLFLGMVEGGEGVQQGGDLPGPSWGRGGGVVAAVRVQEGGGGVGGPVDASPAPPQSDHFLFEEL